MALLRFLALALLLAGDALAAGLPDAGADRLPPPSSPIPMLRRDASGRIVLTTPAQTGCAEASLCVGPEAKFRTIGDALNAARDGDTVDILPGTYPESVAVEKKRVKLRGVGGRPKLDCAGLHAETCLRLGAPEAVVETLEVIGAPEGACIRNAAGASFTLRGVICHGGRSGIVAEGGEILIETSEFYENGLAEGTANGEFGGACSLIVRGSTFRDARVGNELTTRCRKSVVEATTLRSSRGARALELTAGAEAMIVGGYIWKGRGTKAAEILAVTGTGCTESPPLMVIRTRFITLDLQPKIVNIGNCPSQPLVLREITIEGAEPRLAGYVMTQGIERAGREAEEQEEELRKKGLDKNGDRLDPKELPQQPPQGKPPQQ